MRMSYVLSVIAVLVCGVLTSCQTGSIANVDDPCFSQPPNVLQDGKRITVRLYDTGRQFLGVERPSIEYKEGKVFLKSSGYVQSAGGVRPFNYDLPKDYLNQDLSDKVFWINMNGEAVPVPVKTRMIP
ncbi:hypothetical protein BVY04_03460 [bacterium M21]|nr:hypothetical protein BVY04_03460 [bacterium M21]